MNKRDWELGISNDQSFTKTVGKNRVRGGEDDLILCISERIKVVRVELSLSEKSSSSEYSDVTEGRKWIAYSDSERVSVARWCVAACKVDGRLKAIHIH